MGLVQLLSAEICHKSRSFLQISTGGRVHAREVPRLFPRATAHPRSTISSSFAQDGTDSIWDDRVGFDFCKQSAQFAKEQPPAIGDIEFVAKEITGQSQNLQDRPWSASEESVNLEVYTQLLILAAGSPGQFRVTR